METPFVFGKIASDKDFTDRTMETERLVMNFLSSVNTIIISPRRWGKSSLVLRAHEAAMKKDKKLLFCFIDLNNTRTEEEFYQQLATGILRASTNKAQAILENAGKFLGRFIPSITLNPSPGTEFKLSLDWKEVKKQPDDILDFAEKIASRDKKKLIVCVDEFQNISEFEDPENIQKKLRSHWQKHRNVSYCLYGSKRHMMMDVFTSPAMPFYKFGDIIFLEKIAPRDWIAFIKKRFNDTGKKIGTEEASMIADLTDCHSYYVQQLAQQTWLRTVHKCQSEIVRKAFDDLVLQMSMLFQNLTDDLSRTQLGFLKALIMGEEQLSSKSAIQEYGLGTSANVTKLKKALIGKEIIDISENKIKFLDPLFRFWLRKHYFKI